MGSPDAARVERLLGGYAGRLLLASSVGWMMIQAGRLVLSPMAPSVRGELGLSNVEIGFVFTLMWGVYALCQYPSGRLSDQLSRRPLIVGGLLLAALGLAGFAVAPNYPVIVLAGALTGFGAGLFPTAARALISDLYVERRGAAFGLHTASGDTGGILAAVIATVVLTVDWRLAYPPVVAVMVLAAVAVHRTSEEPYAIRRVDLGIRETARRLVRDREMMWLLLAYVLFAVTWQASVAFLPTYLQLARGLAVEFATASFAAIFVVGALVKPVAGWLGDAAGRMRVGALGLLVGAGGLTLVLSVDWTVALVVGVVVFAAGMMAFPPVMQAALMDTFPDDSMGGDLGGMRTVYIGVGALGPTAVGAIADLGGFRPAFATIVAFMVAAASVILVLDRRR